MLVKGERGGGGNFLFGFVRNNKNNKMGIYGQLLLRLCVNGSKESWEKIGEDMIKYSFKKCGISHLLDGSEDDVLWRDGDGEACDKVADEMDDVDLYDDMIGAIMIWRNYLVIAMRMTSNMDFTAMEITQQSYTIYYFFQFCNFHSARLFLKQRYRFSFHHTRLIRYATFTF